MINSKQRVAVVTGANKGLGHHVARQLAEAGVLVFVGSRDRERGRAAVAALAARRLEAHPLALDVTDAASLAAAAAEVERVAGRLDILVNNAGIAGGLAVPSATTVDDLRRTYETNVFGVVAATNAFLPLLRRSTAPRIVNVSSGLGSMTRLADPSWTWVGLALTSYQSSKVALNAITQMYAKELAAIGCKVNASDPGYRATELSPTNLRDPRAGDPAEGAAGITRLALLPDDGPTGAFISHDDSIHPW